MNDEEIDLLVCLAGTNNDSVERHASKFLETLKEKCSLRGINVFLVVREHLPLPKRIIELIRCIKLSTSVCPLPSQQNALEDTSLVCNWMVDNLGGAPWVTVSHFDLVFNGDYFEDIRSNIMDNADMIGCHHDGIVTIRREAYRRAGVGFLGAAKLAVVRQLNHSYLEYKIVAQGCPDDKDDRELCLTMDVGKLLELRINSLGMRHVWHKPTYDQNDLGKSDLFVHQRDGSTQYRDIVAQQAGYKKEKTEATMANMSLGGTTVIHLTFSTGDGLGGKWLIACMPDVTNFATAAHQPNYLRSNDTRAVTCQQCKKTKVFDEVRGRERP